jgi:hypothetical protein
MNEELIERQLDQIITLLEEIRDLLTEIDGDDDPDPEQVPEPKEERVLKCVG